ncbi:hypothetical protein [Moheibacter sediminis]|uniref:Uncharacterized protein n=1 Tax=Moheibacter sediminis TaxID=1434700 RepID=A0A1W1YGL2_9FLAO|nr:hypothetical protein [Moheibacter sediminis]SMC35272.1 hypothetical protein SAMN06296427_101341 [Moheibacter sediminis]
MRHLAVLFFFSAFWLYSFGQKKIPEHYSYQLDQTYNPLNIRANVIVLYRTDGTGNFDLEDEEEKALLDDYLEYVNKYVYSDLQKPPDLTGCYTGTDFWPDAKIRIKFNIIKVRNNYAWDYLNSGTDADDKKLLGFSPTEKWYLKQLDDSISNASDIPKGINIYMTMNGAKFDRIYKDKGMSYDVVDKAAAQFPSNRNLQRSSQVHLPNRYLKYLLHRYKLIIEYETTWEKTRWWHLGDAKGLAHEFGHNFGLSHANEYHQTNTCQYSLMSQKSADPKNYLQPTEIKKIHWNLTRTNMMQFVTEDSHYGANWIIEKDTVWDKPRRFYSDIEIAKNITLTISDSIVLPPQSFIKLNQNSKIVFLEKGKIVNAKGEKYENFQKHKTSKIIHE